MTTTASKQALLIREMAGPEKMPWVKIAYTLVAPAEISLNREEKSRRRHTSLRDWLFGTEASILVIISFYMSFN